MKHSNPYVIAPGAKVSLKDRDPDETGDFKDPAQALQLLEKHGKHLFELQQLLYAEGKRALLVVLQAMDAGGKDGAIRHIFSGVNPQGCVVTSFKQPSTEELQHDYLWRIHRAVPARGMIGIFNRSHYEDVLVGPVHGEIGKGELRRRFDQINEFERLLVKNGTVMLKFFLHISLGEQRRRLQARIDDPAKSWKINPQDLIERKLWERYQRAYEDVFRHCNTRKAPWYIIPANKKWFRNVAISKILVDTLQDLHLQYPRIKFDSREMKVK